MYTFIIFGLTFIAYFCKNREKFFVLDISVIKALSNSDKSYVFILNLCLKEFEFPSKIQFKIFENDKINKVIT